MPLSPKPVAYMSLDKLFDKRIWRTEVHSLLPIEIGAKIPPKMKEEIDKAALKTAKDSAERSSSGVNNDRAIGETPLGDQTSLVAASSERGTRGNQATPTVVLTTLIRGRRIKPCDLVESRRQFSSADLSPKPVE